MTERISFEKLISIMPHAVENTHTIDQYAVRFSQLWLARWGFVSKKFWKKRNFCAIFFSVNFIKTTSFGSGKINHLYIRFSRSILRGFFMLWLRIPLMSVLYVSPLILNISFVKYYILNCNLAKVFNKHRKGTFMGY